MIHSVCEDIPQQLGEGLYLLLHLSLYWSGLIRCIMSGGGLTDPQHSLRTKFKWLGSSLNKTQADRVFWCFSITGRPSVIGLVYQKCAPDNSDLLKLYNYLTLGLKDPSRKVMFAFCVLWQFCSLNNACSKIRSVYCIGILINLDLCWNKGFLRNYIGKFCDLLICPHSMHHRRQEHSENKV